MKTTTVKISQVIGSGYAVAASDGKRVYDLIAEAINSGDKVAVSFENTTRLTTAFLNAAVGQLYGDFSAAQIKASLAPPVDAEPWQLNRLKAVVDRAKIYFADPEKTSNIIGAEAGSDDDN